MPSTDHLVEPPFQVRPRDRKSTRLNSSHVAISYAVFCLKNKAGNQGALLPLGALRTRGWSWVDWFRVLTFSFLHLNSLHLAFNIAGVLWLGAIIMLLLAP